MLAGHMEPLLAMLLLYLCIAPAGAYLSIDRWWKDRQAAANPAAQLPAAQPILSVGANISVRLIQVHFTMFCLMMGLTKLAGLTWWNGEAMWVLAAQADSRLVDVTFLKNYAYVVNAWTHAVVLFELTFPLLIWNRLARPLMMAAAVLIWAGLLLVTGLVSFYLTLLAALLAFVPPSTWRRCIAYRQMRHG